MGKAKPAKHTAAELARKTAEATTNKGGGKAGMEDRKGGKAGHSKFLCSMCGVAAPSATSMKIHFESKHPNETFDESKCVNKHEELGGQTTTGVAVRGSTKKK
eukprot:NODE_5901_length_667_cov_43.543689_g4994_i0.p2 GENE.NODE_5901_length_667_cov_43.543689_g4994_i0~~NODE_5901_length_667_cov_43.543689_g4994_i0.p2  ORF type:complete len:103 (-),score=25.34 NODE_5901_length_667_cov_43.543689_g4994_i0:163-471(-)